MANASSSSPSPSSSSSPPSPTFSDPMSPALRNEVRRLRAEAAARGREHASLAAQHASLVLEKARQVYCCEGGYGAVVSATSCCIKCLDAQLVQQYRHKRLRRKWLDRYLSKTKSKTKKSLSGRRNRFFYFLVFFVCFDGGVGGSWGGRRGSFEIEWPARTEKWNACQENFERHKRSLRYSADRT